MSKIASFQSQNCFNQIFKYVIKIMIDVVDLKYTEVYFYLSITYTL